MRMRLRSNRSAFTMVELLTVMAVILILAGITVGSFSYANNRAARSRAEAEIRALTAACENYKADTGEYPRALPGAPTGKSATDNLNAVTKPGQAECIPANQLMYQLLSGLNLNGSPLTDSSNNALKSYYEFRPNQLKRNGSSVYYVSDPWGNAYGYSTARFYFSNIQASPSGNAPGYNPTVDIWSTANKPTTPEAWTRNW